MVTSVIAGLAIGQLGMTTSLVIALALTLASFAHVLTVAIPEAEIVHADGAPKPVDFAGAWRAIREVPSLIWLIIFSTFNTLIGGVVVAPQASELIYPIGLAVQNRLTVDQVSSTFSVYPSTTGSIAEAARRLHHTDV